MNKSIQPFLGTTKFFFLGTSTYIGSAIIANMYKNKWFINEMDWKAYLISISIVLGLVLLYMQYEKIQNDFLLKTGTVGLLFIAAFLTYVLY